MPRRVKPFLQKIDKNEQQLDGGDDNDDLFDPLATPALAKYRQQQSSSGSCESIHINECINDDKIKDSNSRKDLHDNHNDDNNDDNNKIDNDYKRMFEQMSESEKEQLRQRLFDQCHQAADNSRNGFPEDAEEGRKVFESVYIQQKALLGATHPDTIRSLCCLAEISHNLNRYEDAAYSYEMAAKAIVQLHQEDDEHQKRSFHDTNNPDAHSTVPVHNGTLFSKEMLNALYFKEASCLYSSGQVTLAEELWKKCYYGLLEWESSHRQHTHTHHHSDNHHNNSNDNSGSSSSSGKSKNKKEGGRKRNKKSSHRDNHSNEHGGGGMHPMAKQCRNNLVGIEVYRYHRMLLNGLLYAILPVVVILMSYFQTITVLVYGVSFLAFLTILAPGLIHILVDHLYTVPPERSGDIQLQKMQASKQPNINKIGEVKINVTVAVVVVMFLFLIGLVWALNDHLRAFVLDYVWFKVRSLLYLSTSSASSSSTFWY